MSQQDAFAEAVFFFDGEDIAVEMHYAEFESLLNQATTLEQFAASCRSGKTGELSADNGNVALAVVYAALRSLDRRGQMVGITEVVEETRAKLRIPSRAAA